MTLEIIEIAKLYGLNISTFYVDATDTYTIRISKDEAVMVCEVPKDSFDTESHRVQALMHIVNTFIKDMKDMKGE